MIEILPIFANNCVFKHRSVFAKSLFKKYQLFEKCVSIVFLQNSPHFRQKIMFFQNLIFLFNLKENTLLWLILIKNVCVVSIIFEQF